MSQIDENQVHDRLKRLSQVEPGQEAMNRAMQKVRNTLTGEQTIPNPSTSLRGALRLRLPRFFVKFAAAAVLMIGAGFVGGRLSTPKPLNVQQLQAAMESSLKSSLEPAIRQQLHNEFENRLQSTLTAERNMLKQELAQQVHRDLETYAEKTLTAVGNLMDQRLMNFARMVEAARIKDRQHVAAAFDYMGSRFGDGLVTLAAQRNNLSGVERADSSPDVSEN